MPYRPRSAWRSTPAQPPPTPPAATTLAPRLAPTLAPSPSPPETRRPRRAAPPSSDAAVYVLTLIERCTPRWRNVPRNRLPHAAASAKCRAATRAPPSPALTAAPLPKTRLSQAPFAVVVVSIAALRCRRSAAAFAAAFTPSDPSSPCCLHAALSALPHPCGRARCSPKHRLRVPMGVVSSGIAPPDGGIDVGREVAEAASAPRIGPQAVLDVFT
jgi:hypothetical protein